MIPLGERLGTPFTMVSFDLSQLLQPNEGLEWLGAPLNTNESKLIRHINYELFHD